MARFDDKNFLVTGGTSGIGLATAKRLVQEGGRVLVTGTNEDRLRVAKEELGVHVLRNDAGDPAAAAALAEAAREHFDHLDGVFFNAGFGRFTPVEQATVEDFDEQFAVNVRGPLLQTKALSPQVVDGGAIVLNASIAHRVGMPGGAIYASTKAAVRTMTRVIARELSPRGIRVNAVSPGPIATNFFDRTGMPKQAIDEFGESLISSVPLGRFGRPEEIAGAVAFLLSSDASYVTGIELVVDGGMTQL